MKDKARASRRIRGVNHGELIGTIPQAVEPSAPLALYVMGFRQPIMIVPMSAPAIDGAKGMRLRLSSRT